MAIRVVSNVIKRGTTLKSVLRITKEVEIWEIEHNIYQLLHQHLKETLLVLQEGENRIYAITSSEEQENSPDVVTCKAYVVADALSRLSMGSTSPFEEEKRDYSKAVQTSTHRSQTFGFHRRRDSGEQRKRGQAGGNAQPRPNPQDTAAVEPCKRNRFYVLKGREEQVKSTNMFTGMLQVLSTSVYALLDTWSTISSITPLLANTFEIFLEVLHDLYWVFRECIDSFVIVFIDEIQIYYKTKKEHEQHLRLILQISDFLGHVVSDKDIDVDTRKNKVVKNWAKPLTPTDIRSFLGSGSWRVFLPLLPH
nr:uncharacterized protein LOC109120289 [Solanum lycopersicum]